MSYGKFIAGWILAGRQKSSLRARAYRSGAQTDMDPDGVIAVLNLNTGANGWARRGKFDTAACQGTDGVAGPRRARVGKGLGVFITAMGPVVSGQSQIQHFPGRANLRKRGLQGRQERSLHRRRRDDSAVPFQIARGAGIGYHRAGIAEV